jgi:hypothetical protein
MPLRHAGHVDHLERGLAGSDGGAVGKHNPLALVLTEELVANGPVRRLVLAPVGMNLSGASGGSASAKLFIAYSRDTSAKLSKRCRTRSECTTRYGPGAAATGFIATSLAFSVQ